MLAFLKVTPAGTPSSSRNFAHSGNPPERVTIQVEQAGVENPPKRSTEAYDHLSVAYINNIHINLPLAD